MKQVSFLIKPASSLCNLRCTYCFYKDVSDVRTVDSFGVMKKETMNALIKKSCKLNVDQINYCFQGGEPTVAGVDFFKEFISLVKQLSGNKKITYAIQTNATLLNDDWFNLFKENNFLVGVSLDGFLENHDYFRVDSNKKGTFETIRKNIEKLEENKIDFNILTVLTNKLSEKPDRLFNFYKKNNIKYIQLIPCLPSLEKNELMDAYALKPKEFAKFYKKFFDRWYEEYIKGNYISVTLFDNLIPMFNGVYPSLCGMLGKCNSQFVVEGDGSIYPCDFYVLDEYKSGNINTDNIEDIIKSDVVYKFLHYKRTYSKECPKCKFKEICRGNCRRLSECYYNESYCGYSDFLNYAYERMIKIASNL